MRASDAKRAAMLIEALGAIDELAAELRKPAWERRPMRILEIQAGEVDPDDRQDIDIGAWLHLDAATGAKILDALHPIIVGELETMGVTFEKEPT